jgi:hypothetical protein
MDIKRIVHTKDKAPVRPRVNEEMPSGDGHPASARTVMDEEVRTIFSEEIRKAAKQLVEEQRMAIRLAVEESKRVIREVLEEEKASILGI